MEPTYPVGPALHATLKEQGWFEIRHVKYGSCPAMDLGVQQAKFYLHCETSVHTLGQSFLLARNIGLRDIQ